VRLEVLYRRAEQKKGLFAALMVKPVNPPPLAMEFAPKNVTADQRTLGLSSTEKTLLRRASIQVRTWNRPKIIMPYRMLKESG